MSSSVRAFNGEWLEAELTRQLAPVAAPEALWDRIRNPRPSVRPASTWALWPAITLTILAASCILVWQISHARGAITDLSQLSDHELQTLIADSVGSSRGMALSSADPIEIRNWVKTRCNIDIALPNGSPASVRLLGARLIRAQGLTIAAVAYKVAGEPATLFVSRRSSASGESSQTSKHLFSRAEPALWTMGEEEYAIASPLKSHAACQMCHSAPAL
jgi:anti-sigma factor RsiW